MTAVTLSIEIPAELAGRLRENAARLGLDPPAYAKQLIEENLPPAERAATLHELFAQWDAEDATDDPAEIEARRRDWEEMKKSMNENHSSNRVLFP